MYFLYVIYLTFALIAIYNIIRKKQKKYIFIPLGTACLTALSIFTRNNAYMNFCSILYLVAMYINYKSNNACHKDNEE
jgi:hypothetical protein